MSTRIREVLLVAVLASGCTATRGREFTLESLGEIEVGTTKRHDILDALGDPTDAGFAIKNQFPYPVLLYQYVEASPSGVRSRQLRIGFATDDRVVFYRFESNFEEDSSDFDMTRVRNLLPGKTTASDVARALGAPSGRDFTFIDDKRYDVWLYGVARIEDVEHPVLKRVELLFDERQILASLEAFGDGFSLDE